MLKTTKILLRDHPLKVQALIFFMLALKLAYFHNASKVIEMILAFMLLVISNAKIADLKTGLPVGMFFMCSSIFYVIACSRNLLTFEFFLKFSGHSLLITLLVYTAIYLLFWILNKIPYKVK